MKESFTRFTMRPWRNTLTPLTELDIQSGIAFSCVFFSPLNVPLNPSRGELSTCHAVMGTQRVISKLLFNLEPEIIKVKYCHALV